MVLIKKIFLIGIFAFFLAGYTFSQKIDAAKVPAAVRTAFQIKFPSIKSAKWEIENGNYEAGYSENGQSKSVLFSSKGAYLEGEVTINISDLPKDAIAYVNKKYAGSKIKDAAKITKADGTVNFEAEVNGKDVIFDTNGMFIKEVKD